MKKIILTLLALSFALMAFAQVDITIGTGTSTGRYPLNDFYVYSRSQSLYMESEIGAPGTIHKLRWYRNDTGANTAAIATTQIWLKSVTNAVLTGTDWEDPGTLVAEISNIDLGAGGGWYEVDITDFAYSGGNLLVSVYTQNAPYTTPHAYWRYTSTTGINTIRSGNSDSSNPPSLSLGTSRPNIQINMTTSDPTSAPNPAVILSPTDAALNVALDASLNWSSGGGFPDGYYLSFGTVDPYTTILDGEDMEGDTSYEPQNLAYGTEYWWQVVPYNTYGNATACPTWSFTTMADPTILADDLPHTENFDDVTTPDFPMGWDSITNTSNSYASFGTYTYSTPNSTPNHVRMYNSGDAEAEFTLITPPIDSDIASLRVKFYAKYSSGGYLDVGVWDGSTFSSVETVTLNTSYTEHIVNLDSYVGAGDKIAFFGYFDGTYNYIYLDDITIEEIPLNPIISVVPNTWDFGTMMINTTNPKEFIISNVGAGTLTVSSINVTGTGFALAEAFSPVSLLANESDTITVNFTPTTEDTYSGNIAINDNRAVTNIALSGVAVDPTIYGANLPHTENFDDDWTGSPAAPLGWTVINANSDSYYWSQANTYISPTHSGDYAAHGMGNTNDYLITPLIDLSGTNARISWWDMVESASKANSYKVLLSTTDTQIASFTEELGDFTCLNTDWTEHFVNLSEYTDETVYIAFYQYASASTIYGFGIDDVKIDIILPQPPEPATLVWPLNGITTLMNPLLKWAPSATGEPATGYKVYLNDSGTFTEGDVVYEGTNLQYQTADLVIGETYYWQVTPINAHGVASSCPTWSFSTPGADQLAEGFESTWPPLGWDNTGSWSRSSSYVVEGTYSAYKSGSSSTQYVLSTPMLSIGATSTLQFGAAGSSTSATLEIVYSSDRTTWTQLGSAITYAAAYTFYPQVIDLSSLTGNDYYIGFRTGLSTSSNYIDHIIGPDITPLAPGAPTLTAPIVDATDVNEWTTFTWTAPTTGGIPSGYNIYLDTVDGTTLYASDVSSPYTVSTPLAYNTPYYWTVVATNSVGDSDPATVRSFTTRSDPTIYVDSVTPWLEDFGTATGDWPVLNWSQLSGLYGVETPASGTQWYRDDWLNGETGNNAAKINIYGSSRDGWLVTPPVSIPAGAFELKFDLGLTDYGNSNPIEDPAGQLDDKFIVFISDSPTMTNPTVLRLWDNAGSAYAYNTIPHTGTTVAIPLEGVTGTKYFAFYGESTATGGDNDLFVDNVKVQAIVQEAPNLVTMVSPENGATGVSNESFLLSWTPDPIGGTPTHYNVYMGTSEANVYDYTFDQIMGTSFDPVVDGEMTFNYSETWYWTVDPVNEWGQPSDDNDLTIFSFTIMDDPRIISLPYSQNFDGVTAPAMPAAWTGYVNSTSTYATAETYSSTTYAQSPPNSVKMYNSSDMTADLRIVTPQITVPMNSIKLSFYARVSSTPETVLVGTVNTPEGTFTQLDSFELTTTKTQYVMSLADYAGTDQYICFKHAVTSSSKTIYIDDVYMEELVDTDMSVVSLTGMSYGFQNTPIAHTVTVKNNGTEPVSNYTVYLKSVTTRAILGQESFTDPLAADATNAVEFTWNPTSLGAMDIYGEVYVADDAEAGNNTTDPMAFNVYQEGILFEGFEGGVIPANWTVLNADGGTQVWQAQTINPYSGTYAARVRYETSSLDNDDWLITPPLQVTSGTTDNISFWMRTYSGTSADAWQVLISTTDTNPASFTMIDEGDGMLANYVQKSYNLDSYGDAIIYLAVRYMGAFDWYLYVDEFVGPPVYEPASLDTPEVTISTVGSNVVLNWDAIPYATSYEVMAADAPEGPYTLAATVTAPTYSTASLTKKFFKVIAKAGATRSIVSPVLSLEQQLLQDEMDRAARSRQ